MLHSAPLQPRDEHNLRLEAHVHPADWTNPVPATRYHLVVIGAGTAGLVAAAGAAALGARVALIERDLMGGDCLNVGCVPSKGVISAARVAAAVRTAGEFGIDVPEGGHVDFGRAMERMRRLRASIAPHDSAERFRKLGVDVFLGAGRFTGGDTIQVGDAFLRFRKAVIATGARAAAPAIPGLNDVPYLTNETVFSLTERPGRLAVIGAGPIGCELTQAFARLGSQVWLIEEAHGVLPREDRDAAALVQAAMMRDGVQLLCCGRQTQVSKVPGALQLTLESHGGGKTVLVDQLLVAVGRAPNLEGLGLDAVGVKYDERRGVEVNDRLQTTNRRIFAAGDICSPYKFTHAADFMARIVIQNALFFGRARVSRLVIPWCTYTSPELAHVGISAAQAAERGQRIDTYTVPLDGVDRAILDGGTGGFVKIHTTPGSDRILGATIVAPHAGELISEVTLAMTRGLGLKHIAATIHPYPTLADAIRKAGDLCNRTRLTPFRKRLLKRWFAWTT